MVRALLSIIMLYWLLGREQRQQFLQNNGSKTIFNEIGRCCCFDALSHIFFTIEDAEISPRISKNIYKVAACSTLRHIVSFWQFDFVKLYASAGRGAAFEVCWNMSRVFTSQFVMTTAMETRVATLAFSSSYHPGMSQRVAYVSDDLLTWSP